MKRYFTVFATILTCVLYGQAQHDFEYKVSLKPISLNNLPGLHSFAFGQHEGKWLIIGGREDGLHARQPFASFPESENNTNMYVVDKNTKSVWSSSVTTLPTLLREQLQSTNMNFHQMEDTLYIIGGYGYSDSKKDHVTYPYLTTVIVSSLIDDIINGDSTKSNFKQIEDSSFAVCGGQLNHIDDQLYLVGGQNFTGRYNPMGHNTYVQTYTNEIRSFHVNNSGSAPIVSTYNAVHDAVHLRRRDYNLLPQIYPNGTKGLMISAGVFQPNIDLPFLYPVDITPTGYTPQTSFNQYLSHYHSAHVSMFDSSRNAMHMLFFGGMSQYYYKDTALIKDDKVPFVKTISRLSRNSSGVLKEFQMNYDMPDYIGASAELIVNESLTKSGSEIILLNPNQSDSLSIGYIVGGIQSPTLNPFSSNQTSTTKAHGTIYEVLLSKTQNNSSQPINGINPFQVQFTPNPIYNYIDVHFDSDTKHNVDYFIVNTLGQVLQEGSLSSELNGSIKTIQLNAEIPAQELVITLVIDSTYFVTKKLIKY